MLNISLIRLNPPVALPGSFNFNLISLWSCGRGLSATELVRCPLISGYAIPLYEGTNNQAEPVLFSRGNSQACSRGKPRGSQLFAELRWEL